MYIERRRVTQLKLKGGRQLSMSNIYIVQNYQKNDNSAGENSHALTDPSHVQ
jgi:hypothetical protein